MDMLGLNLRTLIRMARRQLVPFLFPLGLIIMERSTLNTPYTIQPRFQTILFTTKINPLKDLLNASDKYTALSNTWLTFEYVLIKDSNDNISDANRLIKIISRIQKCKLNIIPYNMTDGMFQRPDEQQIKLFMKKLKNAPFPVTIRWSKGTDIDAGCGQLVVGERLISA